MGSDAHRAITHTDGALTHALTQKIKNKSPARDGTGSCMLGWSAVGMWRHGVCGGFKLCCRVRKRRSAGAPLSVEEGALDGSGVVFAREDELKRRIPVGMEARERIGLEEGVQPAKDGNGAETAPLAISTACAQARSCVRVSQPVCATGSDPRHHHSRCRWAGMGLGISPQCLCDFDGAQVDRKAVLVLAAQRRDLVEARNDN